MDHISEAQEEKNEMAGAGEFSFGEWLSVAGLVVSVVGAGLTVYYSRSAKKAAELARESAHGVRLNMLSIDTLGVLDGIDRDLNGLSGSISEGDWVQAARFATEVRTDASKIAGEVIDDAERLDGLKLKMKDISTEAHKFRFGKKKPSEVKLLEIVSDQRELVADLRQSAMRSMERRDVERSL